MSEGYKRGHGLNPFFILGRAQRAGITEHLDSRHRRTLSLDDPLMTEVHRELASKGCPVFPESDDSKDQKSSAELLIPEGARDINTLLTQPMDVEQQQEVLVTIGRTMREVYDKTGYLPLGIVTDALAVAFEPGTSEPSVYLVPPYSLAQPDERTLAPEMFSDRTDWQDSIWMGWSDER